MEFKKNDCHEMIKFMSMGNCKHVHNWEFRITNNSKLEVLRDGKVINTTILPTPDCVTHAHTESEKEKYNDELADDFQKVELTLVHCD